MDTTLMIGKINDLFHHHRQSTSLDIEYTDDIFDFLTAKGIISQTRDEKMLIFGKAKISYKEELEIIVKVGNLEQLEQAKRDLRKFEAGYMEGLHKERCQQISRQLSIKQYFDTVTGDLKL